VYYFFRNEKEVNEIRALRYSNLKINAAKHPRGRRRAHGPKEGGLEIAQDFFNDGVGDSVVIQKPRVHEIRIFGRS